MIKIFDVNNIVSVDLGSSTWCTQDELQVLVPLINQNQTEKAPGLEDLTKVYLDRILDYMITQVCDTQQQLVKPVAHWSDVLS